MRFFKLRKYSKKIYLHFLLKTQKPWQHSTWSKCPGTATIRSALGALRFGREPSSRCVILEASSTDMTSLVPSDGWVYNIWLANPLLMASQAVSDFFIKKKKILHPVFPYRYVFVCVSPKVQKHVHRKPCAQMFIAAWFIRAKRVQMYIHYERIKCGPSTPWNII